LDQQDLCLNHFLLRCYAKLEGLDPGGRRFLSEAMSLPAMRAFIEECSRETLEISLKCENLTNLQRGRLLDILLWTGELFVLLRTPGINLPQAGDSAISKMPFQPGLGGVTNSA
jgi:hypothetical protein